MSDTPNKKQDAMLRFVPDISQASRRTYSNYVSITHTGLDFTLSFLDVVPPTKEQVKMAKEGQPIPAPLQCDIVIPNQLVPSLIEALESQYEKYQNKLADAKKDNQNSKSNVGKK